MKDLIKICKSLLPVLILFAIPIIFFRDSLFSGNLIILGDFTGSDLLDIHLPYKFSLHQSILQKSFPLWESNLNMGYPLLAEGQTGIFYPINLILAVLHPALAMNLSIIAAFIFAALGTFFYAKLIYKDKLIGLFAGLIFAFSGFFVSRAKHINMIAVASLFPFSVYFLKLFFLKNNWIYALLSGVFLGLMLLAGHPEMAFYCYFIYLFFFVFEVWQTAKEKKWEKILPKAIVWLILIFVIALGLSAIQSLPTLELIGKTERLNFSYESATAFPFHPKNIATLFSPYLFGNPATATYKENIRETGIFWENSLYVGLIPLVLILIALIRFIKKREKDQQTLFFLFLAIFSFLIMISKFTPFFGFLWSYLPGFSLFRFPTRFNLFFIFAITMIAAKEISFLVDKLVSLRVGRAKNLQKNEEKENEDFEIYWPFDRLKTFAIIITFCVVDLFVFANNYFSYSPANEWLKIPESAKYLKNDQSLFRIWSLTQYGESPYQLLGWRRDLKPILAMHESLPPNDNLFFNLASFSDRPWFEGGLNYQRRNAIEKIMMNETDPIKLGKIAGLFNVKYILSFSENIGMEIEKVKEIKLGEIFSVPLNIFENKQVMPRVYFVPEAKVITKDEDIIKELSDINFYPFKTVVLEKQPKQMSENFSGVIDEFRKNNWLNVNFYSSSYIEIETEIKDHGFLVLSDSFYPGWKVLVDEKEETILPANYLVRAVELEPGKHLVKFIYDPTSFKIGLGITSSILGVLIFLTFFQFKNSFFKNKNRNSKNKSKKQTG